MNKTLIEHDLELFGTHEKAINAALVHLTGSLAVKMQINCHAKAQEVLASELAAQLKVSESRIRNQSQTISELDENRWALDEVVKDLKAQITWQAQISKLSASDNEEVSSLRRALSDAAITFQTARAVQAQAIQTLELEISELKTQNETLSNGSTLADVNYIQAGILSAQMKTIEGLEAELEATRSAFVSGELKSKPQTLEDFLEDFFIAVKLEGAAA